MHEAMCKALKMQLADRTEDVEPVARRETRLEGEVEKIKKDFEEEQKSAFEITRDMTRQYKGMQEQLVDRITQLSVTVQELQDKLEEAEQKLEETVREKDRVIAAKDDDITLLKSKMEDMAQEFGGMLKETLDKMRERIELSSTNFDMEASASRPVQRQMPSFHSTPAAASGGVLRRARPAAWRTFSPGGSSGRGARTPTRVPRAGCRRRRRAALSGERPFRFESGNPTRRPNTIWGLRPSDRSTWILPGTEATRTASTALLGSLCTRLSVPQPRQAERSDSQQQAASR